MGKKEPMSDEEMGKIAGGVNDNPTAGIWERCPFCHYGPSGGFSQADLVQHMSTCPSAPLISPCSRSRFR